MFKKSFSLFFKCLLSLPLAIMGLSCFRTGEIPEFPAFLLSSTLKQEISGVFSNLPYFNSEFMVNIFTYFIEMIFIYLIFRLFMIPADWCEKGGKKVL